MTDETQGRAPPVARGRSARHRVLTRAVKAWNEGHPHQAWEILDAAGMGAYWPTFRATALSRARQRFLAAMKAQNRGREGRR